MTAPLWASTAVSSAAGITNLAHIEWCNFFEPSIPLGVSTQGQKQVLLNGYPDILWQEPSEAATSSAGGGRVYTFPSPAPAKKKKPRSKQNRKPTEKWIKTESKIPLSAKPGEMLESVKPLPEKPLPTGEIGDSLRSKENAPPELPELNPDFIRDMIAQIVSDQVSDQVKNLGDALAAQAEARERTEAARKILAALEREAAARAGSIPRDVEESLLLLLLV